MAVILVVSPLEGIALSPDILRTIQRELSGENIRHYIVMSELDLPALDKAAENRLASVIVFTDRKMGIQARKDMNKKFSIIDAQGRFYKPIT